MKSTTVKSSGHKFVPNLVIKPISSDDANVFTARHFGQKESTIESIDDSVVDKENAGNSCNRSERSKVAGVKEGTRTRTNDSHPISLQRQHYVRAHDTHGKSEWPLLDPRQRRPRAWVGNCGLTVKNGFDVDEFRDNLGDCLIPEFSWPVSIVPRINCGLYSVANVTDLWRTGLSLTISEIRSLVDFHGWQSVEKCLLRRRGSREDLLFFIDRFENKGAHMLKMEATRSWGVLATRVSEAMEHCNGYIKCLHFWEIKFGMIDMEYTLECTGLIIF